MRAEVQVLRELERVTGTPAIADERSWRRQSVRLIYNVSSTVADTKASKGLSHPTRSQFAVRSAQDAARAIEASGGRAYCAHVERQGQ